MMDKKQILLDYIDLNLEKVSKKFVLEFKSGYNISHLQMSTMWYLNKHDGLTMGELANKLRISKQQTTKLIDTMENKTLVIRCHSLENKRNIKVNLTEEGKKILREVEEKYATEFIAMISNEEEADCLFASMENIVRILSKV